MLRSPTHATPHATPHSSSHGGLQWDDVCYSVPVGRRRRKWILANVSGSATPGCVLAVMGPSGSGAPPGDLRGPAAHPSLTSPSSHEAAEVRELEAPLSSLRLSLPLSLSSAGKTTLLKILAQRLERVRGAQLGGSVRTDPVRRVTRRENPQQRQGSPQAAEH